ncbi:Vomp family autotransporter [Bartonella queenslandensis]|uniref:Vomp family autotransporter n=1 Tax=Bartonella queenslandensis TaxID=481138 RepID=UPI0002EB9C18|nr:Vomp family autotransporter [Bartonella queenslandensis]
MKKIFTMWTAINISFLRVLDLLSFVKELFLALLIICLSSVSPVFAANLAIRSATYESNSGNAVGYKHGSHGSIVLSGDDDHCGVDNVIGRGGKRQENAANKITAEQQYKRFINGFNGLGGSNAYGTTTEQVVWAGEGLVNDPKNGYMGASTGGSTNISPEAYGVYSFATGCGSSATGNYSTAFGAGATAAAGGAQAFGVSALASGKASVAIGIGSEASGQSAVAIGGLATARGETSIAIGTKAGARGHDSIAIGIGAMARVDLSIAIGQDSSVTGKNAIAIGNFNSAAGANSLALGSTAVASAGGSIALGYQSLADRSKGKSGYDPITGMPSTDERGAWKSTEGALSIGSDQVTRQITGVAAGTEDTDAVNVAQLKALREVMVGEGEWKLSANGSDESTVAKGKTVDFSVKDAEVGKGNLKIEKIDKGNEHKVQFTLNDDLKLTSVATGKSSMSDKGFYIKDGPQITSDGFFFANDGPSMSQSGIYAGDKQIKKVAKGTNDTDAVNFAQLKEIKSQIEGDSLVKWDEEQKLITIGKGTAGTEINIAGYGKVARTISGVKEAVKDDEAVNKAQLDKSIKQVSQDALLWDDAEGAFVAKHEKNGEKRNSKLKFLLDGEIAKGSTEAITGNQLYFLNQTLASYFGGGAKYENGQWTAPHFQIVQFDENGKVVEKKSYDNVADALDGVNNGMTTINNRIDDVINKADTDALKWDKEKGAYDAGRDGQPSKITNVADGKIEKDSKDAVNGGQLWQTNERINSVEKDVQHISKRVENIGDTVINIDGKVNNIDKKVDGIAEDAVRYDRDEKGKKTNKITLAGGDPSEPVMIDNVTDGKIEKGSKEAINGGQLHDYTKEQMKVILDQSKQYTDQRVNNIVIDAIDDAVERANNYTNMKFEALNYRIENVRKEAKQAAAIGLAVSNLRYFDDPGFLSVSFGSGLWRSQSAFAFGAGYTSESGSIRSNLSVTTSGGHWGVGGGITLKLK